MGRGVSHPFKTSFQFVPGYSYQNNTRICEGASLFGTLYFRCKIKYFTKFSTLIVVDTVVRYEKKDIEQNIDNFK